MRALPDFVLTLLRSAPLVACAALAACERCEPPRRAQPPDTGAPPGDASAFAPLDGGPMRAEPAAAIDASMADAATADAPPKIGDDDRAAIARALCGSAPVRTSNGRASCLCPAFTEFGGVSGELSVDAFYPGSFTGPDRQEVAVRTTGCESGAGSSFSFDGLALVRRTARGFERLAYDRGPFGECTTVVSGARVHRLVCQAFAGHAGLYYQAYKLVTYAATGASARLRAQEFLSFSTNVLDPAVNGPDFRGELRVLTPKRFEVMGRERFAAGDDRALAVEIDVDTRVECIGGPPHCARARVDKESVALRFVFDGAKLSIAPESRAALARLRAREPDQ